MTKTLPMKLLFCTGAVLLLVCWGLLNLTSHSGADAIWVYSHILLLISYVILFAGALSLYETIKTKSHVMSMRYLTVIGLSLVTIGLVAFTGQLTIDLVVGHVAQSQAAMNQLFTTIHDNILLHLAYYAVGPALFYIGLLILVLVALKVHALQRYTAILAAIGITVIGIAFAVGSGSISSPLYPIGVLCLAVGFFVNGKMKS